LSNEKPPPACPTSTRPPAWRNQRIDDVCDAGRVDSDALLLWEQAAVVDLAHDVGNVLDVVARPLDDGQASFFLEVEQARRDLSSPDPATRLRAVQMLKRTPYLEAAVPLAALVTDPQDEVQFEAIGAEVIAGVENHHNFAWKERHQGRELIVQGWAEDVLLATELESSMCAPVLIEHAYQDTRATIGAPAI